jgi:putative membrane protein
MWHGMEGVGWGWIGLGIIHMVLFWAIVLAVFAGLVKWRTGRAPGDASAMDILNARYARGDLSTEQFEQMRRDIGEQA